MTNVSKRQLNKFVAVLLSIALLLTSVASLFAISNNRAGAADTITVYFDTSCTGENGSAHDWAKDMANVYFYAYNDNSNNGIKAMTPLGESGKSGGYLFSATFSSSFTKIKFISCSSWKVEGTDKQWETDHLSTDNGWIYILNESGTNRDQDGTTYQMQGMYKYKKYEATTYQGKTFKLCNMTNADVSLSLVYSNDTDASTVIQNVNVTARATGLLATVPASSGKPYTQVEIKRESTLLKKYVFSEGKILGNTFYYGVTENLPSGTLTYGDTQTLCYYGDDFTSTASVSGKKLYFNKNNFVVGGTVSVVTATDGTVQASPLSAGNATYVTSSNITVGANEIFSVIYNGVTYNLTWSNASKNLVSIVDNVANINAVYSLQSVNNVFNNQNYITVQADFYDYQYDKFNNSQYVVSYDWWSNSQNKWANSTVPQASEKGEAKRPYLAINEALSASSYGSTAYPLYLGQFWLPIDKNAQFNTSSKAYTAATAQNQRAAHNIDGDKYYVAGEQEQGGFYEYFGFGNKLKNFHWAANLAYRTDSQAPGSYRPYDAVVQGLVSNQRVNGKLMAAGGTQSLPYFDPSWWTGTFTTSMPTGVSSSQKVTVNKADYLTTYHGLAFPFFEIDQSQISFANGYTSSHLLTDSFDEYDGTYYVFDSLTHVVQVDAANNELDIISNNGQNLVYDNYGDGDTVQSSPGFFPFNSKNDNNSSNLHYGFGVQFSIDFYLTEHGTVDGSEGGTPLTFTFQGDDDVWVFLDDKLILDMGGAHKNAIGEINFANQSIYIGAGETISDSNKDNVVSDGKSAISKGFAELGNITNNELKIGKHKITMYYLERGMLNSNLYVLFNLPMSLTTWELQEDTDFSKVNSGFLNATQYVADYDIFNYTIENMGTTAVVGTQYLTPDKNALTRSDTDSGTARNTVLNKEQAEHYTQSSVIDSDNLYLDTSQYTSWEDASAVFGVYFYNDTSNTAKFIQFTAVEGSSNLYSVPYDSAYEGFCIFRLPPATYPDQTFSGSGSERWNAMISYLRGINGRPTNKNAWWNRGNNDGIPFDMTHKNRFVVKGDVNSYSFNATNIVTKTVDVVDNNWQHTYNFNADGTDLTSWLPLVSSSTKGVTFRLTDPFATQTSKAANFDTRKYNNSGSANVVSLQYAELATFSKQFSKGSTMRVIQLDELSAPVNGERVENDNANKYNDATSRSVAKYYTTYTKSPAETTNTRKDFAGLYDGDDVISIDVDHIESMYDSAAIVNYSNSSSVNLQNDGTTTTYTMVDPSDTANEYAHVRQVYVNEVNTVSLYVEKELKNNDTDPNRVFTFKIAFSKVFGDLAGSGDSLIAYNSIDYTKFSSAGVSTPNLKLSGTGTFTLKPGEQIKIEGIPVGTQYTITEVRDEYYELDGDDSENLSGELDNDTYAIAFNKRKTGEINISKLIKDTSGQNSDSDTNEFEVHLKVITPSGVHLSEYDIVTTITAYGGGDHWTEAQKNACDPFGTYVFTIRYGENVCISGLPYGVEYYVEEVLADGQNYYVHLDGDTSGTVQDKVLNTTPVTYEPFDADVDITNYQQYLSFEKKVLINTAGNPVDDAIMSAISNTAFEGLKFGISIEDYETSTATNTTAQTVDADDANTVVNKGTMGSDVSQYACLYLKMQSDDGSTDNQAFTIKVTDSANHEYSKLYFMKLDSEQKIVIPLSELENSGLNLTSISTIAIYPENSDSYSCGDLRVNEVGYGDFSIPSYAGQQLVNTGGPDTVVDRGAMGSNVSQYACLYLKMQSANGSTDNQTFTIKVTDSANQEYSQLYSMNLENEEKIVIPTSALQGAGLDLTAISKIEIHPETTDGNSCENLYVNEVGYGKQYNEGYNECFEPTSKTTSDGSFDLTNDYNVSGSRLMETNPYDEDDQRPKNLIVFDQQFQGGERLHVTETEDTAFETTYSYSGTGNNGGVSKAGDGNELYFSVTKKDQVLYTNELLTENLTVTKNINVASSVDQTFNFTVTFSNVAGHELTSAPVTKNFSITVPAGDTTAQYVVHNIPINTSFTVAEDNSNTVYVLDTSSSILSGKITAGGGSATVVNNQNLPPVEMPEAGAFPPFVNYTILGISVMGVSLIALAIYKRKLQAAVINTVNEREV